MGRGSLERADRLHVPERIVAAVERGRVRHTLEPELRVVLANLLALVEQLHRAAGRVGLGRHAASPLMNIFRARFFCCACTSDPLVIQPFRAFRAYISSLGSAGDSDSISW